MPINWPQQKEISLFVRAQEKDRWKYDDTIDQTMNSRWEKKQYHLTKTCAPILETTGNRKTNWKLISDMMMHMMKRW